MHMLLRTILIFLKKPFLAPSKFGDKTTISMRVLPTDLDLMWHVNNGIYFSYMDFGRWDSIFRIGAFDKIRKAGWYFVVASETMKFKKSLKLWDKFELVTHIKGHDERYFFIHQKFTLKGELVATGLVKVRFLKHSGGTVPTEEVVALFEGHKFDDAKELAQDLYVLENKYLI
jgi:YbgC/YbaW family acyl-CoA thioester hydrolase